MLRPVRVTPCSSCVVDPSTVAFLKSRGATKHPPSVNKEHPMTSVASTIESETAPQSSISDSIGELIAGWLLPNHLLIEIMNHGSQY